MKKDTFKTTGSKRAFIKSLPNHWKPGDFSLFGEVLSEPVRHIAQTVCLLESRCNDYAEYLRAIVGQRGERWMAAIDQWNMEECRHGELLRLLCETADPSFSFQRLMDRYTGLVRYHVPDGKSVRGSLGAELVARCVVEALASTFYRVLADATGTAESRRAFSVLAQDEARHFGMFLRMLEAEAELTGGMGPMTRCVHALRRMLALEDDQIMAASWVVARRADVPLSVHQEANRYIVRLYRLYRWKHLQLAARMLFQTLAVRPTFFRVMIGTTALWLAIKLRWIWARAFTRTTELGVNFLFEGDLV